MPDPTDRRRATASSFPKGAALVAELRAIAARHPLTRADVAYILEHVGRWRREVLGETGPAPTGDAAAAAATQGDPIGKVL